MLTNERRRQILNSVKASGYPGGVSEAFSAAEQGIDVVAQYQEQQAQEQEMQVANTQEEQETGLREEHAAGNTQASMAFPDVQPNQSFNTVGMKAPIDIQKIDGQGHLVESYKNVPPGIANLPTGSAEGTIIESPAAYRSGGYIQKYQLGGANNTTAVDCDSYPDDPACTDQQNSSTSDTPSMYDTPSVQDTMEWGVGFNGGKLGFKTPYGSYGMLPQKPESWGEAAGMLVGPFANLTGLTGLGAKQGKSALDKLKSMFQTGGFNFNPADFDPNYDAGSISDNTHNSNYQEDQSNFKEKESTLAKIKADKAYAEKMKQLELSKGTLVNTTHKNAGIALSNSFLGNQLDGGYGGSNIRKDIAANPNKIEEIYKNNMRSSGQNTMRDIALSTASLGSSAGIANSGTSTFAQRALAYPGEVVAKSIEKVATSPTARGMVAPALKGLYNQGYVTGLPKVIGGTIGAGIDYSTGDISGVDAGLKVAKNAANFVPAIRGFNKIAPLADNYGKIKNVGKAAYDVYKGNYTNAGLRLATLHPSLGTGGKYGLKFLKKFTPKTDFVQKDLPLSLLGKSAVATPKKLKRGGYRSKHIL